MTDRQENRVYIRELAELVNRRIDTVRKWDRNHLPKKLQSRRDGTGRNWRYWTPAQVKGIFEWIERTDRRPGKGLPHWNPSEDEIDALLERLRQPRTTSSGS